MSSTTATTLAAADRLEQAQRTRRPTPPVRDLLGSTDIAAAYAVQDELNLRRRARGAQVVGRKIGLTSPAVQKQLGVDQPDFGVLFDDMVYADGAHVPATLLLQPKVEAEVAFVLAKDLEGELDLATVRDAVEYAVAALEIVDSRVADWDITITDTVADNGSSALYVLGTDRVTLDDVEPKDVEMSMTVDGETVSTGTGAACLGDPLEALLWLARTAQEYGDPLRAGQVVLSGALGPMAPVVAGNSVHAQISRLGSVSVTFSNEENA
jgi:2-keto-4-pentenoate hydratase